MGDRRRRRQRSDISSEGEEEEKEVWSATESENESEPEPEQAPVNIVAVEPQAEVPATVECPEEFVDASDTPEVPAEASGSAEATVEVTAEVPGVEDEAEAELEHLTEDNVTPEVEVAGDEIRSPEESPEESGSSQSEGEEDSGTESDAGEKTDEENPTFVPRKGNFYEHDDRNGPPGPQGRDRKSSRENDRGDGGRGEDRGGRGARAGDMGREQHTDATGRVWGGKKEKKWIHDMYNEEEQKPKEDWERERTRREERGRGRGRGDGSRGGGDGRPRNDRPRDNQPRDNQPQEDREQKQEYRNGEVSESRYRRADVNKEVNNTEPENDNDRPRRGGVRGTRPARGRRECEYKPFIPANNDVQTDLTEDHINIPRKPEEYPKTLSGEVEKRRRETGQRGGRRDNGRPAVNNEEEFPDLRDSRPARGEDKRRRGGQRGRNELRRDGEEDQEEVVYERSDNSDIRGVRRSARGGRRQQDSNEAEIYEDAPEDLGDKKSSRVKRRPNERDPDEMWRQIEQLKMTLEQVTQGQQVLGGPGGQQTVVGKGRSRPHARTSPNQDSLIYKIAQEKAQELAATNSSRYMSHATGPSDPESGESEEEERNTAAPPPQQPKMKSSSIQTEGEVITMKPKRYSQRSKTVDPNALREKMLMSMEDYAQNQQYAQQQQAGYSQLPFNPYAAEFHTPPEQQQEGTFTEAQLQQMLLLQRMAQSYQPPPQHHEYNPQQQMQANMMLQQQNQAAMMNSYVHMPPQQVQQMNDTTEMLSPSQQLKRSKAIPIIDPNNMIHMAQVIHES